MSRLTDDREHELENDTPSQDPYERESLFAPRPEQEEDGFRAYEPIQPKSFDLRSTLSRLWAPILVVLGIALKFGAFAFKFFGIFIAVAAYTLIWGWRFAVGFVVLLAVHEAGHFIEARMQGLRPSLPVFIPFLGAYVAIKDMPNDPWRLSKIAIAGPILGGAGAAVCYALSGPLDSDLLSALAYTGFFLNLFNLLPILFFDGGNIWRSFKALRAAGDPRAHIVMTLYLATAAALALGMWASHVPQSRL